VVILKSVSTCGVKVSNSESADAVKALVAPSVPSSGTYNLKLNASWVFPNCYLQLPLGSDNFRTILFMISTASGSPRTWRASDASSAFQSMSVSMPGGSSPGRTASASNAAGSASSSYTSMNRAGGSFSSSNSSANAAVSTVSRRPQVTLSSDSSDVNLYMLPDKTDCLDNRDIYYPDCWILLNISHWLPQWFLATPQCGKPSADTISCNHADTNEPWTTTFLRESSGTSGGGVADCSTINSQCDNVFVEANGSEDTLLERARFKYVRQNIYGKPRARYPINI